MGPVQVLVVGFDAPTFSGQVLAELTRLRAAGIVGLVDLLFVTRTEDGMLETLDKSAELGEDVGALAAAVLAQPKGDAVGDPGTAEADPGAADQSAGAAWSLADAVPPGSAAAVALIEHLWAIPLTEAIQQAGGRTFEETWLAPGDLEVLTALMAQRSG